MSVCMGVQSTTVTVHTGVLETDADEFRKVSKEVRKKKQWAYYRVSSL